MLSGVKHLVPWLSVHSHNSLQVAVLHDVPSCLSLWRGFPSKRQDLVIQQRLASQVQVAVPDVREVLHKALIPGHLGHNYLNYIFF